MPRARVERVLSDDGQTKTIEVEVGERGTTKTAQYSVPSNAKVWQEFVLALTDTPPAEGKESPLQEAYRLYVSSVDRRARAEVYESLAQESTVVTIGKEKIDLMEMPLARVVRAYNGINGERIGKLALMGVDDENAPESADTVKAVDRNIGFGPWRTMKRKLLEAGKVKEQGDQLVTVV